MVNGGREGRIMHAVASARRNRSISNFPSKCPVSLVWWQMTRSSRKGKERKKNWKTGKFKDNLRVTFEKSVTAATRQQSLIAIRRAFEEERERENIGEIKEKNPGERNTVTEIWRASRRRRRGGGGKTKFRDNGYWKKFSGQPLQADTKHRTAGAQFVLTH